LLWHWLLPPVARKKRKLLLPLLLLRKLLRPLRPLRKLLLLLRPLLRLGIK
jgi:hypothetical protein